MSDYKIISIGGGGGGSNCEGGITFIEYVDKGGKNKTICFTYQDIVRWFEEGKLIKMKEAKNG